MVDKRRHKRVKVKLNLVVSNIFDQNADMIKIDIVNIGLHFFHKDVRLYAASCSEV